MTVHYKGLTNFITDIREATTKEEEVARVEKELTNCRSAFFDSKSMTDYDKKKYVLKLMYITIMGYDLDFGHMQALELIGSSVFQDKQIGYLALGTMINEQSEVLRLVGQSLLSDLTHKREVINCLALTFIGNYANADIAETLANNVSKILMNPRSNTYLLKKSSLCLLRCFKKNPDVVPVDQWVDRIETLLQHTDAGVLTAVVSLLQGFAMSSPMTFEPLVAVVCRLANKVIIQKAVTGDYMYDHIPAPWLLVKCFQFLQLYPPVSSAQGKTDILAVMKRIINTENKNFVAIDPRTRSIQRHNAMLAVLFESINLLVKHKYDFALVQRAIQHIRAFLLLSDPDLRYLSLEAVKGLCPLDPTTTGDDLQFVLQIEKALVHPDISLRRRALDVLFELCSDNNSDTIVPRLLEYLEVAEIELHEELVLKIAILSEKYPVDMQWFIDVILRLVQVAGDSMPQEIWYRTVQIISSHPRMQHYAVSTALRVISQSSLPEMAVQMCGYIIGEYHTLIGKEQSSIKQILTRMSAFLSSSASPRTKGILITAVSKIASTSSGSDRERADEILKRFRDHLNEDMQERACESLTVLHKSSKDIAAIFQKMPPFPVRQSILLRDLKKKTIDSSGLAGFESKQLEGVTLDEDDDDAQDGEEEELEEGKSTTNAFGPSASKAPQSKDPFSDNADQAQPQQSQPQQTQQAPAPQAQEQDELINFGAMGLGQTPTSSPPASSGSSAMDDLMASLGFGSTAATSPQQAAKPQSASTDLMSIFGMGSSSAPSKPQPSPLFNQLILMPSGKLYEDQYMTITCQYQFLKNEGRVMLTFTNKTTALLSGFQPSVQSPPGLACTPPTIANTIQGGQSVHYGLVFTCQEPFAGVPVLTIQYLVGLNTQKALLNIPAPAFMFMTQVSPPRDPFIALWNASSAAPGGLTSATFLPASGPLNQNNLQKIVSFLETQGHMARLNGYDPSPQCLCFAGLVQTAAGTGQETNVLMMKVAAAQPQQLQNTQGMVTVTACSANSKLVESVEEFIFPVIKSM
ncbi:putative AP-2 complex subunit alpha [Blattamonas nauphoetae]|uniref:AP-2 complex subunit alpha n=1 Tax=Blattamonas nauphoetae TaxID=2049346 RepID=A0ABQ9XR32_9EUKA|nr:putative AP-2 complex subunit alpha [Blattamonas nauphoetae]